MFCDCFSFCLIERAFPLYSSIFATLIVDQRNTHNMRIKKAELRKRLPQLPINYPGPDVVPFDYEREKAAVENLCKRLADNEADVRDAVLAELPRYLREVCAQYAAHVAATRNRITSKKLKTRRPAVHHADELTLLLLKLSIGLFYCLWHSDKPLVQHACAENIALLIHAPEKDQHRALLLKCMLQVFAREWIKIDHWRLDKFMAFIRKLAFQSLRFCCRAAPHGGAPPTKRRRVEGAAAEADSNLLAPDDVVAARAMAVAEAFNTAVVRGPAVGLLMHCNDLWLDEFLRNGVASMTLFTTLANALPLASMAAGNLTEKRVVDHFVVPIAAGGLETISMEFSLAAARAIADRLKEMSVSKSTVYSVRPVCAESQLFVEMYLERHASPESFAKMTTHDEVKQLQHEVSGATQSRFIGASEVRARRLRKQLRAAGTHGGNSKIRVVGKKRPRASEE